MEAVTSIGEWVADAGFSAYSNGEEGVLTSRPQGASPEAIQNAGHGGQAVDAEPGLVEACQRGRTDAFARVFELHGARMKSIALNMLTNRADAEDAVQETFLKVYRAAGEFKGQSAFSTWIYRILVNTCTDMLRRRVRRLPEISKDTEREGTEPQVAAPLEDHPLRLTLERLVARLNTNQRTVFLLCEVEGFSHAEVGALLNISMEASKNRLFEAKQKLQRMILESPETASGRKP